MVDNNSSQSDISVQTLGASKHPVSHVPRIKSATKQRSSHTTSSNNDMSVYIPDLPSNIPEKKIEQMIQTRIEAAQRMTITDIKCYGKLGVAVIRLMNEEDQKQLLSSVQWMVLDMERGINISFVSEIDLDTYIVIHPKVSEIPSSNEVARRYAEAYTTRQRPICEAVSTQFPNIFRIILDTIDELNQVANAPDFKIEDSLATVYPRVDCSFFEDLPSNTNDQKILKAIAAQINESELPSTFFYVQHNRDTGNAIVLASKSIKKWIMEGYLTIDGQNVSKKAKLAYRVLVSPVPPGFHIDRILNHTLFVEKVISHKHINDNLMLELDNMETYNHCIEIGAFRIDKNIMDIKPQTLTGDPTKSEIDALNWYETSMLDMKSDIVTIINDHQHPIFHYNWNPDNWNQQMEKAKEPDQLSKKYDRNRHLLRMTVMLNTIGILRKKKYLVDDEEITLKLERMRTIGYDQKSKLFYGKKISEREFKTPYPSTNVKVVNEDCLVLYEKLVNEGYRPLLLNMANATNPGGGYRKGDGAQEENIFRRSDYYQSLDAEIADKERSERLYCTSKCEIKQRRGYEDFYPMEEFGAIYTSGITVFRQIEKNGYAFMKHPLYNVCAIAMAAYRDPLLTNQNMLENKFAINTHKKIENIFAIAHHHKHDCLVLSAFGCGAFRNPPEHVALLFKSVIYQYAGYFKTIYFAIVDDHNAGGRINPHGNLRPFEQILNGLIVKPPKTYKINGVSGPYRILNKSSDGQITLSDACILYLPPCHHGTKCRDLKDPQHNNDFLHPPLCLLEDTTSACDEINDEVHMFTFIHKTRCKYEGKCDSTDPIHLDEYNHPEYCKNESRCIDISPEHLLAYRHLPICRDGMTCSRYLSGDFEHNKSYRHCKSICPNDNCCVYFHEKLHMNNTIHSFRPPCPFTPYNCSMFVKFFQNNNTKRLPSEVETHCLTFSHVCPYGRQCNKSNDIHYETSIHVARQLCPDGDRCKKLDREDHLESFSHPGTRDIRLFCREPGYQCSKRFVDEHLRRYRHGKNHNHLTVAPSSNLNASINFVENQRRIIRTVNKYIEVSKWEKAKISKEILGWIRALQPVHRCGKIIFESILVHGHVMSRYYMKSLNRPTNVAKAVIQHPQIRSIFLQHNNPAVKDNAFKLIKALVKTEFAKTGADGITTSDTEHEYNINLARKKLKPPLNDNELKAIYDWTIKIAQASIQLHSAPMGIGFNVDEVMETDKHVFSILGPHLGYYYGDIVIIFKQEIMFHSDANFSIQAATSFNTGRTYKNRPWSNDPGTQEERVKNFHSAKLHCCVPRYEYAAATELMALTGTHKKSMNVNRHDVIDRWMHVDSHDVFESHLPQLIPLDYIDCVYMPKNLFESLTPEAQDSAKAVFKDSLVITNHSIDLNLLKPGARVPLDATRKPYQNFVLEKISQGIEERMKASPISRGFVITTPGSKFEEYTVLPMTISQSYHLYHLDHSQAPINPEYTYIYWQVMHGDMMLTISNEMIDLKKEQQNLRCLVCYVAKIPSTKTEDYYEAYSYLNDGHPFQHYNNIDEGKFRAKSNVFYRGCNTDDFLTFCLKLSHKTGKVTLSHAGPNGIYNHQKITYEFNKSDLDLSRIDYIHVSGGDEDVPIRNLTINHEPIAELHPTFDKDFKIDTSRLLGKRRASIDHIVARDYRGDVRDQKNVSNQRRQRSASAQPVPPPPPVEKPSIFRRIMNRIFGPSETDKLPTSKSHPYNQDRSAPLKAEFSPSNRSKAESPPRHGARAESPPYHRVRAESPPHHRPRAESPPHHRPRAESPPHHRPRAESPPSNRSVDRRVRPRTPPMPSSNLPRCKDSVYCLNQDWREHTEEYSHLCRFNELCRRAADEPHLIHERHDVPKCFSGRDCSELTDPVHRAKYRHRGLPDYLLPCRYQENCYDKSSEHRIKFSHGEELPSIKKNKTLMPAHTVAAARAHLIPCKWGADCRKQKDPQHLARYSHPAS